MLDTTILLAGIVWPRWPYEVLQHALQGDFQLVLTQILIEEARRKFNERFPKWTEDFENFLKECNFEVVPVPSSEEILANQDLIRDITDIPIALAAINAGVDYFVSEDKDFTERNKTTAKLHNRLNTIISGTFLREVMGWTSEELERVRGRTWKDVQLSEN